MDNLHIYTLAWNEEAVIGYFLRHYLDLVKADKIIVYDNRSTDATAEICRRHPRVEVRSVGEPGQLLTTGEKSIVRGQAWKESRGRAKWAAIVDIDELLFHHDFPGFWKRAGSFPVFVCEGREMICDKFPIDAGQQLVYDVRLGTHSVMYCKPILFQPDRIHDMQFTYGNHHATPITADGVAVEVRKSCSLYLLHYKHLGWDYFQARTRQLLGRVHDSDRGRYSRHYLRSDAALRQEFVQIYSAASDVTT